MVRGYIDAHHLLDTRSRMLAALGSAVPEHRRRFIGNLGDCLDVMAQTALAINEQRPLPPYEERFRASTRREPVLVDTTDIRTELRAALSAVGFETTSSRDLRETLLAWEAEKEHLPVDDLDRFAQEIDKIRKQLMTTMRKNMFAKIDFDLPGHDPHLEDVAFDGLQTKIVRADRFTASNAYTGGVRPDGSPALGALFEYNANMPLTRPHAYDLVAHEIIAHYVDTVMGDLRWRAGQLGLEAPLGTMCTTRTILMEGFAQNSLRLIHGGSEANSVEALGPDQRVEFALQRLEDVAKMNASIWHQLQGLEIEEVRRRLRKECVLPDHSVKKMSGAWATHPVFGPMYGPAYRVGQTVVDEMIKKHGPHKVIAAALHKFGYLDIDTLPGVLEEAA